MLLFKEYNLNNILFENLILSKIQLDNIEILRIDVSFPELIKEINLLEELKKFKNLKKILMTRGKINYKCSNLPIDVLQKLLAIKLMDTSSKFINDFLEDSERLETLEELTLFNNNIEVMNRKLHDFVNIKKLTIGYNRKMHSVNFEQNKLLSLTILNLSCNTINILPDSIEYLLNLEQLILDNNNLVTISKKIGNLKKLKMLVMSRNKLEKLPDSIGDLSELKILNIDKNKKLGTLPVFMSNLKNLVVLQISNIGLTNYPVELCYLPKLERLIMCNNKLERIPNQIHNLTNLIHLSIRHNNLNSLPIEITNFKNFRTFEILQNSYSSINNLSPTCEYFQIRNLVIPLTNIPSTMKEIRIYLPQHNMYFCNAMDYLNCVKIPVCCKLYIENVLITDEMIYDSLHGKMEWYQFLKYVEPKLLKNYDFSYNAHTSSKIFMHNYLNCL